MYPRVAKVYILYYNRLLMKKFEQSVIDSLNDGGICVIPTDTIYGIVGRALDPVTVERIYSLRSRDPKKPCIILISSYEDLIKFNVVLSSSELDFINVHMLWPGKVSIILTATDPQFSYLTRGTNSLSFRMPNDKELQELISQTGPLIAPSANTEGNPPATNMTMAKEYFGDAVDCYIDEGELIGVASTIIKCIDGSISIVREGAVHIPMRP